MKQYEFTITLSGYGETPKAAWFDACEGIYSDKRFETYDPETIRTTQLPSSPDDIDPEYEAAKADLTP